MPKKSRRNTKLYKMKGCSRTKRLRKYKGGGGDTNLAYSTQPVKITPNPYLAYTGKGGLSQNINGENKTIPSTGPPSDGYGFINSQITNGGGSCSSCSVGMKGGSGCGCGQIFKGGSSCSACSVGMTGGGEKHRNGCKCSLCKMKGGNNAFVGSPWTPSPSSWPGVNGSGNYYENNSYKVDPETNMIANGANPPFSIGGKRRHVINKNRNRNKKTQKGGTFSNFLGQDFINLGRQFQYGLGSAYNAISGYAAPTNPMPWKGQLPNTPSLSTIKNLAI